MNIKLFTKITALAISGIVGIAVAAEQSWFAKDLSKMSAYFKLIKNSTNQTLSLIDEDTNQSITLAPNQVLKNEQINLSNIGSYKLAYFKIKNSNDQTLGKVMVRLASRVDYNTMYPELTRGLKDRFAVSMSSEAGSLDYHWAENYDASNDQKVAVGIILNFKGNNLEDTTFDVVAGALAQD